MPDISTNEARRDRHDHHVWCISFGNCNGMQWNGIFYIEFEF